MKATKQGAFAFHSICLNKKVSSFVLKFIAAAVLLCAPLFAFAITWNVTSPSTGQVLVSWSSGRTYTIVQEQPEGSSNWSSVGSVNGATGSVQLTRSNGRYFYRLQDCLVTGNQSGTTTSCVYTTTKNIQIFTTPPNLPSGFTVPAMVTSSSFTISWTTQQGVTHHLMDEQINGGTFSTIPSGLPGTSLTLSKPTGTYAYRLRACNPVGCSANTGPQSVSVYREAPASVPGSFTAPASDGDGSYSVSWSSVSGATSYLLQEKIGSGNWLTIQNTSSTSKSFSGKGNSTYSYQVAACNPHSCTAYTTVKTVDVALAPGVPSSISAPALHDGDFTVSWGSASGSVTAYDLDRSINGASYANAYDGAALSFTYSNLAAATYTFRVRACRTTGSYTNCSGWRTSANSVAAAPSGIPGSFTVPVNDDNGAYSISWTTISNTSTYELQERIGSGNWATIQNTSATSRSISGKGNNTYGYRVRACNDLGCSGYTSEQSVDVSIAPGVPSSISVPALHDGDFTVSWGSASGSVTTYDLDRSINGASYTNTYDGTALSFTYSNLAVATYTFRVRACRTTGSYTNCSGWRTSSNSVAALPASVPGSFTVPSNDSDGAYAVTWASVNNTSNYELQERTGSGSWGTIQNTSGTSRSISGKSNNTYGYRVRACNDLGCSAYTSEALVTVVLPATGVYSYCESTSGYQIVNVGSNKNGGDFAAEAIGATYDFEVEVDNGAPQYIEFNVDDWDVLTYNDIVDRINADLLGATASMHGGNLKITSDSVGSSSSIALGGFGNNTNHISGALAGYQGVESPVNGSGSGADCYVNKPAEPVLAGPPVPDSDIDAFHEVNGSYSVSPSGAFSYSVPIMVAQGSGGFSPNLTLSYNSESKDGNAGHGWSLNLDLSISRCRQTYSSDRVAKPVTFTSEDRLCLNGSKLHLVSGSWMQDGSVYKTEVDSFTRVTVSGESSGQPLSFIVEQRGGIVEHYGSTSASRLTLSGGSILEWKLSDKYDPAGNRINYEYITSENEKILQRINYAYGSTSSPSAHLLINYDYQVTKRKYVNGEYFYKGSVISQIYSYNNSELMRRYELDQTHDNGVGLVRAIRECITSTCTPWTRFSYSTSHNVMFYESQGMALELMSNPKFKAYGDFNGDGFTDVVWKPSPVGSKLRYAYGSLNGNQYIFTEQSFIGDAPYVNFSLSNPPPDLIEVFDFNMDGHDDLIARDATGTQTRSIYLSVPQSDGSWKISGTAVWQQNDGRELIYVDINGDGLRDMVGPGGIYQLVQPGAQLGPMTYFEYENFPVGNCGQVLQRQGRRETGDFNGDGLVDFLISYQVCRDGNTSFEVAIFTSSVGSNGVYKLTYFDTVLTGLTDLEHDDGRLVQKFKIFDMNKDSLSDVVIGTSSEGYSSYMFSTGTGLTDPISISTNGSLTLKSTQFYDMNGDGGLDAVRSYISGTDSYFLIHYWDFGNERFQYNFVTRSAFIGAYGDGDHDGFLLRDLDGNGTPDFITSGDLRPEKGIGFYVELNFPHLNGDKPRIEQVESDSGRGLFLDVQYENIESSDHYNYQNGYVTNGGTSETVCQEVSQGDTCWTRERAHSSLADLNAENADPFGDFGSSIQKDLTYPVFPVTSGKTIVTGISTRTSKAYNTYNNDVVNDGYLKSTYYYYEEAKAQASGRGSLGFATVHSVDSETGLRSEVHYRQDWPFVGKAHTEKVYDKDNNLVSILTSEWVLGECYGEEGLEISGCRAQKEQSFASTGSRALGPIRPYLRESKGRSYDIGTWEVKSAFSKLNGMDTKGNTTYTNNKTYDGDYEALLLEVESDYEYDYSGDSYSMEMGRLTREEVVSTNPEGHITRVNQFDYYLSGTNKGRLYHIYQEPGSSEYGTTTTISYDAFGNETQKYITENSTGQKRYFPYSTYDSRGRYPVYTYSMIPFMDHLFKKTLTVVSRDIYGNATNITNHISPQDTVTERIGFTPFGLEYFRSNSMGERTTMLVDAYHQDCPTYTEKVVRYQSANGSETLQCFDKDRLVREGSLTVNGDWVFAGTQYDALGQVVRKTAPYAKYAPVYLTEYEYDVLGRVTSITTPSYENGDSNATFEYGVNYKTTTNDLGEVNYEYRNALDQVFRTSDAKHGLNEFIYDAAGNLKEMWNDDGNVTRMTYGVLNNKLSMSDPDKGNWTYAYNAFGELTCQQDAKNQHIKTEYDYIGRVKAVKKYSAGGTCQSPSGTLESHVRNYYDLAGYGKLYLQKDLVSGYEKQTGFDKYGRPETVRTRIKNLYGSLEDQFEKYTYNQYGQLYQYFDAARNAASFNNNGVQYSYHHGHLESVRDAVYENGTSRKEHYFVNDVNNFGLPNYVTLGGIVEYTVETDAGNGQITGMEGTHGWLSYIVQDLSVKWDTVGNVTERWERGAGVRTNFTYRNLKENFYYDEMNRLDSYSVSGDASHSYSLGYSHTGNIEYRINDGVTYNYSYGTSCGSAAAGIHAVCRYYGNGVNDYYYYDANGNQVSGGGRTIEYNVSDLPTYINKSGHTTRFDYAPDGTRYRRTDTKGTDSTIALNIGSVEKVLLSDGTLQWKRHIGKDVLVNQTVDSGGLIIDEETKYLLRDHLGSINYVIDDSGLVEEELDYDPWGMRRDSSWYTKDAAEITLDHGIFSEPPTNRGFTDHEMLDDTRLIHMNGRIYDPLLARFVQADPIIQAPYNSQSLNRYSYVWNNPLNATDPSGFIGDQDEAFLAEEIEKEINDIYDRFIIELQEKATSDGKVSRKDLVSAARSLSQALGKPVEVFYADANGQIYSEQVDGVSGAAANDGGGSDGEVYREETITYGVSQRESSVGSSESKQWSLNDGINSIGFGIDLPTSLTDKARYVLGMEQKGTPDIGFGIEVMIQPFTHPDGFDIGIGLVRRAGGGLGVMLKAGLSFGLHRGSIKDQAGTGGSIELFLGRGGVGVELDDKNGVTGVEALFGLGITVDGMREATATWSVGSGWTSSGCDAFAC